MASQLPHLIVGTDFGMTCTGVAYQNLSAGSTTVQWINRWPGRSHVVENKVPTALVYRKDNPKSSPTSWGFQSESVSEQSATDKVHCEWFKTDLDERHLEKQSYTLASESRTISDVEQWYGDFLNKLYECIEWKLVQQLGGLAWADAHVEFLFSTPSTWDIRTRDRFRKIIERSGFGKERNHTVKLSLTEAEAAAVFTSRESPSIFKPGDMVLVCDAGGGTLDLNVLRVKEQQENSTSLDQLDVVQGEKIGSVAIDYDFLDMVRSRLKEADKASPLGINSHDAAYEMMKSRDFQSIKCELGSRDETPKFSLTVAQLDRSYTDHIACIANGAMSFTKEDLQKLFDKQIQRIFDKLDEQLARIQSLHPGKRIAHLVLSGGLGNNSYVQTQLSKRYSDERCLYPAARGMQIRIAPEPQLAVCKGLVVNRSQELCNEKPVLDWRRSRSSYGTLCKERYDSDDPEHAGITPEINPLNNKPYVRNVVNWFIKKGQPVQDRTPIIRKFKHRVPPGLEQNKFNIQIVVSDVDVKDLPYQMNKDVEPLCQLEADLSRISAKKPWWNLPQWYNRVNFDMKVFVGAAHVRLELWCEGQQLSKEQIVQVDFEPAPAPPLLLPSQPDDPQSSASKKIAKQRVAAEEWKREQPQLRNRTKPDPTPSPPEATDKGRPLMEPLNKSFQDAFSKRK